MSKMWRNAVAVTVVALFAIGAAQARAAIVGLYDFNGNGNDSAANPINMTLTGGVGAGSGTAPTYSSDTPTSGTGYHLPGQSLQINGSMSFAYGNPSGNLKYEKSAGFTVQAWIKPSSIPAGKVSIFSYTPQDAAGDACGYTFGLDNGYLWIQIGYGGGYYSFESTHQIVANQWSQVAFSYDNTSFTPPYKGLEFMINGKVDGTAGDPHGGWQTPGYPSVNYTDVAGYGPNPKTAFVGAYFFNSPDAPSNYAPYISQTLPNGTLVDRVIISDLIILYSADAVVPALDYWTAPEPASLALLGLGGGLVLLRRRK